MKKILLVFLISGLANSNPEVYFIEPKSGDIVSSTFTVKFGLSNFGVAPAGYDIPKTGHHHLLVNAGLPEDLSLPIKADQNHIHFGLGQTETEITLEKGAHRLRLLLGNYLHIPHNEPIFSEEIIVIVN
ncbi:MAG: DUF4399 domain-containing protein [Rickettsiales bacterium TMED289]|nr:rod shape-determining protein RodA [Gammaproteobacteria bacterium]RPF74448.1 MAG: DUF4399 domain-containing protein [Rickettsiales bacterium TMED289]